ncbi:MAG: copper resistance protein CopC [Brevundimonas sp.]|uniref:copper resistance CopC family protein n=1 Tax=Brevundimonas sp. TaxID=1871086 RepID=UPI0027337216|nr:copper resistance CopC family protein [Brevundimonas sp.]MDP3404447.1 copper resistance protein CopC [Brevundimonas sp.]
MTKTLAFATAGLVAVLAAGAASAQTAPAAAPHAGHTMPSAAPQTAPTTTAPADPHAGHTMPAGSHAGHDMSAMSSMSVPAPTGTALSASSPAAGAMLNASPTEISMTLPHAMTVDSLVLTNAAGQRIPLSATLSDAEVESLTTPVPTLAAGTYSVAWTASKGANHTMTGTFAFMVH